MKTIKKSIFVSILLFSSSAFAQCCCENIIAQKAQEIDTELKAKNDANSTALESLNEKIKDLNENILINRTTEIKDGQLQNEMNKFNIMPKNLHHASSLPTGVLYLQMARSEAEKENVIASISNQTDAIMLNSKTNLESLKNDIYSISSKAKEQTDKTTQDLFGSKNNDNGDSNKNIPNDKIK